MVLVDTSVWIEHFQTGASPRLASLLENREALVHGAVIGELALGNLGARRARILAALKLQPQAPALADAQALELIEAHKLWGLGIGFTDAHLLASARVASSGLWTLDLRLAKIARKLGIAE